MSKKYKLAVLTFVGLAVLAIMILSNLTILAPGAGEKAEPADAEFSPADDPYTAFKEAREAEKPIVLEFYARW